MLSFGETIFDAYCAARVPQPITDLSFMLTIFWLGLLEEKRLWKIFDPFVATAILEKGQRTKSIFRIIASRRRLQEVRIMASDASSRIPAGLAKRVQAMTPV